MTPRCSGRNAINNKFDRKEPIRPKREMRRRRALTIFLLKTHSLLR